MSAPYPVNNQPNRSGQLLGHKPSSSTRSRSKTTAIGLTSAGLCIVAGSVLLIFVYLVGQGLLPVGATPASDTQLSNAVKANQTATAMYRSTPTTPAITPTPTLPGQGLLDTAVLSNNFDQQTGQILQQSTSFQVDQTIYLVFTMHPGGSSHTACVNWYLNDQLMNPSSQAVGSASNIKYFFYTIMHTPGHGHIDILLSSTTVCSDAILAKRLLFTVSA
jgi:hypothetical protein